MSMGTCSGSQSTRSHRDRHQQSKISRFDQYRKTEQWAMSVTGINGNAFVADWAYVSRFEPATNPLAPDLDSSITAMKLTAGDTIEIGLRNLGGADLKLHAAVSENPNHAISISHSTIESGQEAFLTIEAQGTDPDGVVCISSNDPDSPQTYIHLGDDGSALNLGFNSLLGQVAPDFFSLIDTNGNLHRLSEARGHPVVLVYFATW